MTLGKNKKEKFSWSAPDTANKFKIQVETALGDNLTAIKNLGEFAKQLTDTTSGKLDLKDVNLEVNDIKINGTITNTEFATIKSNASYGKSRADSAYTLANSKQNKGNYIKVTEGMKREWLRNNVCPPGYKNFRPWSTSKAWWCYKNYNANTGCRVSNAPFNPPDGGVFGHGTMPSCNDV